MSLPSLNLDAFLAVAQTAGFSSAAQLLNVTQSALSQRIKNLEDELGLTLFIRTTSGATLTDQGERLLRYCQTKKSLEEELIQDLNVPKTSELQGTIRLAAYSSVLRSVIVPALKPLLDKYPKVLCEFICATMQELPGLLQRAEVDFIVMDYALERANLNTVVLGSEKYVMIESKRATSRGNVFLDNEPNDQTTEIFLKTQNDKKQKYQRSYFDDCYGIIDGVALGLGRAVMPKHLVEDHSAIKVLKGYKSYNLDVVLHYYQQPFYSRLQQAIVNDLSKNSDQYL